MRIKRLELLGFKSSKDKTVLDFPAGITGIVGPNGCGKSNIVDALRWVLGEQSARHLRGRSMEDVIFAGNQHYGPLGMSEVTIILDNAEEFPTPPPGDEEEEESEVVRLMRRVPEVQVTRRLFRSGESEYLLNGRPCRLRDITELFLGTGVGTKAYSIVEQGRVGQIVNAKPDELRLFIEEAAGTTLYRSRKIAAERKIERTRDNLLRVSDVLRELERQANSLRRQARGAVQYQELRAAEDALDRRITGMRLRSCDSQLEGAANAAARERGREQALRLAASTLQRQRDTHRASARQVEQALECSRRDVFEARGVVADAQRETQHLEARLTELNSIVGEARGELAQLEQTVGSINLQSAEASAQLQAVAAACAEATAACEEVASRVRDCDQGYLAWSTEAEGIRTKLIEALGAAAGLRNERGAVVRQIASAEERSERLRGEADSLATVRERLRVELLETERHLTAVGQAAGAAEGSKLEASDALAAAMSARIEAQTDADRWRDECATLRSRIESLDELNRSFAGYTDGVRAFMANGGRERAGARAVVADVIEIESGFERAVAAVLGDRLQYIVVPSTEAGVEGARYLRETGGGRATFLPGSLRTVPPSAIPAGGSLLSDHVRIRSGFEDAVTPLLQGVVITSDLDEASEFWKRGGLPCTFVTREGEVVNDSGTVTGGSENPIDEGLLVRNTELRAVQEAWGVAQKKAREAAETLRAANDSASRSDARLSELDQELHRLTIERVRLAGELRLHEQNLSRGEERSRAVAMEIESAAREIAAARARLRTAEVDLSCMEAESLGLEQRRQELDSRGKGLEAERRALLSELEGVRVREAELRQKFEGVKTGAGSLLRAKEDAEGRRRSLSARVERETGEIERVRIRLCDPALDPETLRGRLAEFEVALAHWETKNAAMREGLDRVERGLDTVSKRVESVRAELGRWELKRKEAELERKSVLEGASERLGAGVAELMTVDVETTPAEVLVAELEVVRGKVRRLGTVNLGAVVELEEIETRLSELTRQRDDLDRSIEDLRGTIARLNRLSRRRFQETFDEVNRIFQLTFPKLFHGGRASLALTDAENLLETGVEIFVQPPGKRLGNLDLLSGGEKAMTAIGLVFALFLHKPSPFCVLDEVDAPLDEANIGRFARMVAEMSERSQFLLITHNKRTMEVCDTLYGVTMPEAGVTRMVSVDLSQAA
ncbi:MAG: chromosome segregation protein SMC [Deltaproteobacteria bacterium]|nr:chromosome segregation protein SMC [Deltaproteobacteria bacterium]